MRISSFFKLQVSNYKMETISYSFIIPHHNSPELLDRCIESIPKRKDIEIIVVDDNSDLWNRPKNLRKEVKVFYIEKENSKWAGHARNVGLKHAKGEWVLFADCDDMYTDGLSEFLEKYKDSNADVVYFNHIIISKHSQTTNVLIEKCSGNKKEIDSIKYLIKTPWNKMVKHSLIEEQGISFEEVINGNDMWYSYQVGFFAKNVLIERTALYMYYSTDNSMTNKKKNPDEYYLCRIKHWYQTNEFYKFIGHSEWTSPILKRFLAILVRKGIFALFQSVVIYCKNYRQICSDKNKFVKWLH